MQNDELEFERDKEILFDFFSHVEREEYAGKDVYVPIFRVDKSFDRQLEIVQEMYPDEFNVYLKYILDERMNIGIVVNKDTNLIESISPELDEIQRLRILQTEKKEKIISDKTSLFTPFDIETDLTKIDDVLHVSKKDFINCINFNRSANRVDDKAYQELYLKNLNEFLDKIKEKDDSFFKDKKEKVKSIGYTMEDFDNYMQEMLAYHFEIKDGVVDQYKPKPFAGLDKEKIKDIFKDKFKPEIEINIEESIHNNNHKAIVSKFSDDRAKLIFGVCNEHSQNTINNAKELISNASLEEKEKIQVNTLLNVRESYLTAYKIYRSYNFIKRWFYNDIKELGRKCDDIKSSLKKDLGIDPKTIDEFLNNKNKVINYNNKVYDYEKLYSQSTNFNNDLKAFDNNYVAITKNSINTDLDDKVNYKVEDKALQNVKNKTLDK